MRTKVTLVARDLERAEKIRLRNELKQTIGSIGVGEVQSLYEDDQALGDMAQHLFEMKQVDQFSKTRALPFFAGVVAFVVGMLLQLAGTWPGCCASLGIIPQSLG